MSQSQIILLVLAVVGVAFGIGVIFIGRRAKPAPRTTIAQQRATTTVADKPVIDWGNVSEGTTYLS